MELFFLLDFLQNVVEVLYMEVDDLQVILHDFIKGVEKKDSRLG